MLIAEFIETYEIDKVKNPDLGGIIDECLNKLFNFYGYLGDFLEPESWYLDRLKEDEKRVIEDPDELLIYIDDISLQMANECDFYITSNPKNHRSNKQKKRSKKSSLTSPLHHWLRLSPKYIEEAEKKRKEEEKNKAKQYFTYKDKTKVMSEDGELLKTDAVKIPLLLAMQDLIQAHLKEQNNISFIIRATQLLSAANHLKLLIRLSELWVDSHNRHVDINVNKKIDNDPINIVKIEILKKLVDERLGSNNRTTPNDLFSELNPLFYNELNRLDKSGTLKTQQTKSKYGLVDTSDELVKRWITQHYDDFFS